MTINQRSIWHTGELDCCDSCRDNDFYPVATDGHRLWMTCDKCGFTKYYPVTYGSSTGLRTDRIHPKHGVETPVRRSGRYGS